MPLRPFGHIAANLDVLAIALNQRIRHGSRQETFVAWIADDGCVFMAAAAHPISRAVVAHAPEQVFQRYRRLPDFGSSDIRADLAEARRDFASRSLHAADGEAVHG